MLMSVKQHKQPPRNVAADIVYPFNSDSDDLDSDDSDESYRLSDAMKDQTYSYLQYDSEFMSGLDEEEFLQKTKNRLDFTKKAREQPPPVLAKFNSENRHSQKCTISAGDEGTAPSGVGGGGKREGVVDQAEGFQILCLIFLMLPVTRLLMNLIIL